MRRAMAHDSADACMLDDIAGLGRPESGGWSGSVCGCLPHQRAGTSRGATCWGAGKQWLPESPICQARPEGTPAGLGPWEALSS